MITVEKPKLRKGLAYVLKTSLLETALAESGIEVATHLVYWTPQGGGSVLEAFYWLPNERVPHRRLYVRAGSVPVRERPIALEQLRSHALPELVRWLLGLHAQPDDSPALLAKPHFNASFAAGRVSVWCKPTP